MTKKRTRKSRIDTAHKAHTGDDRNMRCQSRSVNKIHDGWRTSPAFKGATLDRNGEPLAEPAPRLRDLDRNPIASGKFLRHPYHRTDAVSQLIAVLSGALAS